MKDSKKIWDKGLEESLDRIVSLFRKSIISDAEAFATFRKSDSVSSQGLEVALYKSVMTLNESNKAIMFQRMWPFDANNLIRSLEERAILDVSLTVMEEMEDNWDSLPQELKDIFSEIKKKINLGKDNDKKE